MGILSSIEYEKCPFCNIGILYNTNIQEQERPNRPYFQCSHCGKMLTDQVFSQIFDYIEKHGIAPSFVPEIKVRKVSIAQAKKQVQKRREHIPVMEPGFIVGVIRDDKTKEPVKNAYVYIRNIGVESFTNQFGQFSLKPVPELRKLAVDVIKPGFVGKARILNNGVKCGQVKKLEILLRSRFPSGKEPIPRIISPWKKPSVDWGIHGFVTDTSKRPIKYAIIVLMKGQNAYITETDQNGHYELINILPEFNYPMKVAADGYAYGRRWINITKSGVIEVSFVLKQMPGRRKR